jgi:hypothetical protein
MRERRHWKIEPQEGGPWQIVKDILSGLIVSASVLAMLNLIASRLFFKFVGRHLEVDDLIRVVDWWMFGLGSDGNSAGKGHLRSMAACHTIARSVPVAWKGYL